MGKTVKHVADLLNVLVKVCKINIPHGDYASAMTVDWSDIKIWCFGPREVADVRLFRKACS